MTAPLNLRPARPSVRHHAYRPGSEPHGHPAERCTCRQDLGQAARDGWLPLSAACPVHGERSPYAHAPTPGFKHLPAGTLGLFNCRSSQTCVYRHITRPEAALLLDLDRSPERAGVLVCDQDGLWSSRWHLWKGAHLICGLRRVELDRVDAVRVPVDRCVCGRPALADWHTCGYSSACQAN